MSEITPIEKCENRELLCRYNLANRKLDNLHDVRSTIDLSIVDQRIEDAKAELFDLSGEILRRMKSPADNGGES